MDPFVDQLASLCREHVTRSKWVFVPSHAIGRTLGERIALGGTNWLNLRVVTALDLPARSRFCARPQTVHATSCPNRGRQW
jgi:hypothetical protein